MENNELYKYYYKKYKNKLNCQQGGLNQLYHNSTYIPNNFLSSIFSTPTIHNVSNPLGQLILGHNIPSANYNYLDWYYHSTICNQYQ